MELAPGIDRPMRLAEVLAVSIKAYGDRPWRFLLLGVIWAVALGVTRWLPFAADAIVVALAFVLTLSLAVVLVTGRGAPQLRPVEWLGVAPLLVLVGGPAAWAALDPITAVVVSFWFAIAVFAIPVFLLELPAPPGSTATGHVVRRVRELARTNYVHALLTVLVLFLALHLLGIMLAAALAAFADNGEVAAQLIAHAVFMPLVLIGFAVLYGDQCARARGEVIEAGVGADA